MALTDTQINELIHAHRKRAETENSTFDKYRSFYRSEYWSSNGDEAQNVLGGMDERADTPVTEVNYAYAYVDTMVASVVPPNPAVTILPKKESLRNQAKRREMLVNDLFDRTEIVEQLWEAATLAGVCGRAFFKAFWSERHNRPARAMPRLHQAQLRPRCGHLIRENGEIFRGVRRVHVAEQVCAWGPPDLSLNIGSVYNLLQAVSENLMVGGRNIPRIAARNETSLQNLLPVPLLSKASVSFAVNSATYLTLNLDSTPLLTARAFA